MKHGNHEVLPGKWWSSEMATGFSAHWCHFLQESVHVSASKILQRFSESVSGYFPNPSFCHLLTIWNVSKDILVWTTPVIKKHGNDLLYFGLLSGFFVDWFSDEREGEDLPLDSSGMVTGIFTMLPLGNGTVTWPKESLLSGKPLRLF